METTILFRKTIREEEEYKIAQKYFNVVNSRLDCKNQLVIARYSCLPFYRELEKDLIQNGCELINSFDQHCWIADFGYYYDLYEYTPKSYTSDNFWQAPEKEYVVKGKTNSRKHQWKTHMFAPNKKRAIEIAHELLNDGLIGEQGIIYREYCPLKILETDSISGLPFSNEWRFFFYKRTLLTYGFYWSNSKEETISTAKMTPDGLRFAQTVANIASDNANFFVLDIAQKENDSWILIEVNDGQLSGLSENSPDLLYHNLKYAILTEPML